MGIGRNTHPGASRSVEHPGWNLKPTVGIGTAQITAKNNSVRLLYSFVNADPKSKPRMPWVQQFSKLSSVGVLKPCCTTRCVRTAHSATCRQPLTPNAARPKSNGTGRCATLRAPRPVPLHHRAIRAQMKQGLSPSADESEGSDQHPNDTGIEGWKGAPRRSNRGTEAQPAWTLYQYSACPARGTCMGTVRRGLASMIGNGRRVSALERDDP